MSQPIEEDEIDLLDLFRVLLQYKVLIIGLTLAAALFAVGYSVLSLVLPPEKSPLPNQYSPSALILVNNSSSGGLSAAIASSGLGELAGLAGVSTGGGGYGDLAIKLLKSRSLTDEAAKLPAVKERYKDEELLPGELRKEIQANAAFEYEAETGTITISYTDYDPAYARDLVNRFVELLERRFLSMGVDKNLRQKELLEEKLSGAREEIDRLAAEIKRFQTEYNTLDVESLAKEQLAITAQLRSQLVLKDVELETYRDISRIDDPVVRQLQAEKENITALLQEMESGYSRYQKVLPSQQDLPDIAYRFYEVQRELEVQQKVYAVLRQQYEVARLNAEGADPVFQVLEKAVAPDLKSGPSRASLCIVVTLAAFFLSILLSFVLNAIRNLKNDPEALRRLKGEDDR